MRFTYTALPGRVLFGEGALDELPREAAAIGARALILCTPEQRATAQDVSARLGSLAAGLFDRAVMHVPVETVAQAVAAAEAANADFTVAIGGGSTTGLAKALSLRAGLPSLVIPTTFAGSEVTPIWGLTEGGVKRTGRDLAVLPRTVIYDPVLTLTLPVPLAVASGMNAIAHCVEALYAADGNPVTALMAEEGIRALAAALPRIAADPHAVGPRADALYGCWLAGTVLGGTSMALHHKLCHTLGGTFNLPHAQTHTAVLPHAVAYNAAAAPDAMVCAARALGVSDAGAVATRLYAMARDLGAEMALGRLGMPTDGIERAVSLATQSPYPNPRPITADAIRPLIERAHAGLPPTEYA